jgi:Tol biopolymer transport system component
MYERRRPRLLRVATGVLLGVAVFATSYLMYLRPLMRPIHPPSSPPPASVSVSPAKPACPTARLSDAARLGEVAWIEAGTLRSIDLRTCRQSVLVGTGAAPPVRFSPDGRWLAFGEGQVVQAAGGSVQQPFGSLVKTWEWSPTTDVLAGVTQKGGVLIVRPGSGPEALLAGGSGVAHLAFSPDGRRLAVDRVGRGIQVLDVATTRARTVLSAPDPAKVPDVAGWSPDGRWVSYWRGPVGEQGGPFDAVPSSGGAWVNVFDPMLPYRDFLSSCGHRIALSAGGRQEVSVGKQIVLTGPPDWAFHDLTDDFTRSWIWPACSPDGRWLAVTDSLDQMESANHTIPRGLWLLATDGSSRRLLVTGAAGALEFPRWSSDGSVILVVVRSGTKWSSPGSLLLVQVNSRSGRLLKRARPLADLGSAPGPGGHQGWAAISDWYRPSRAATR